MMTIAEVNTSSVEILGSKLYLEEPVEQKYRHYMWGDHRREHGGQ